MELKDNKTEERKNRFTGESIMLTKEEAIKHDRIFMNELAATLEDKQLGTGKCITHATIKDNKFRVSIRSAMPSKNNHFAIMYNMKRKELHICG